MTSRRSIEETTHGVTLYPPTDARPYFRLTWYTPLGERKAASAGKDHDRALARAWEIDDELAGAVADPTGRSVNDLLNAWLPAMQAEWQALHYDKYLAMARRFISPLIGGESAWALTKEQVKAVADAPTAKSAKRHTANALGAMLTWGHANDWIAEPREWFFPKQPRTAKASRGRQHGESAQFIPPRLRPSAAACRQLASAAFDRGGRHAEARWLMVAAAASCGPRQGELFAAPVDALRPEDGEWFIDRQVIRVKGGGAAVTDPKWGRVRTTLLPEVTIWGEPFRDRLLAYAKTRPPGGLLFPAPEGGYLHPSNVARDWLNATRASAGGLWVPPKGRPDDGTHGWTWHSLRHAFCTDLLRRGAQDPDVALWAGHRDSGVTRAMYVGATAGAVARGNALLAAAPADEDEGVA